MFSLKTKLILNTAVDLAAVIVMILTMLHFIFSFSTNHGVILLTAYLARELMALQAKSLEKEAIGDFFNALLPKEKPTLSVVDNSDDETTNTTSH